VKKIFQHQLLSAAQIVAGQARDRHATALHNQIRNLGTPQSTQTEAYLKLMNERMDLVFDSFLIGAAMTLKLLHGDGYPEPFERNYTHTDRLNELLTLYGLNAQSQGSQIPEPSSATSSAQKIGE